MHITLSTDKEVFKPLLVIAICLAAVSASQAASRFSPGSRGDTALVAAVKSNDVGVAMKLLSGGADPNSADDEGNAVLDQAISNQSYRLVAALIEKGADPNYDFMGTSPLFHAKMLAGFSVKGNDEGAATLRLMERHGAKYTDFDNAFLRLVALKKERGWLSIEDGYLKAIEVGDFQLLPTFLDYFYDVNKPITNQKIIPLHYSAIIGPAAVVTYLIDHGADVNELTDKGYPPIWFARKRPEIQALLLQRGARPFDGESNKP